MSRWSNRLWAAVGVATVLLILGVFGLLIWRREWYGVAGLIGLLVWQYHTTVRDLRASQEKLSDYSVLRREFESIDAGGSAADPSYKSPLGNVGARQAGTSKAAWNPGDSLLQRQKVRTFMERTDHLAEARAEAERWVGRTPRSAKRLANRLMFTVAVAASGELLTTDSGVRGAHLGKWVALVEGWPRLALQAHNDPSLITRLERVAGDEAAFAQALKEHVPNPIDVERLRALLAADDPAIGDVAWALTRLAPSR